MKKTKKLLISLTILLFCGSVLLITANKSDSRLPNFEFPVKCHLNQDCWVSEYPDVDPSPDWHDYTGGKRTVNSHLGTDIIIQNLDKMRAGIPVLATADGIVTAIRDGVNDINVKKIGASTVDKIGCGNAAVIDIGNGWTTVYCHMRKGSVTVKNGERVSAGQRLGYVGMSGLAETPHLHFQVQHFKQTVDPFTGNSLSGNEKINHSLWTNDALSRMKYSSAFIYNIDVTDKVPDIIDLQSGDITSVSITMDIPAVFLWADIFGLDKDDVIQFSIKDSNGKTLVDKRMIIDKSNVRRFFYLRHNSQDLKPGLYHASVKLLKKDSNYSKNISFKVLDS